MVPWHLAFPHRGHIFTAFDRLLYDAKVRMFQEGGGSGLEFLFSPTRDPWIDPYPVQPKLGGETAETNSQFIIDYVGRKGWFDADRYRDDTPNFELICELFRIAHAQGTRCFLVIYPESSRIRKLMPSNAGEPLLRGLPRALGPAAPVILDYREAMPDDAFEDLNHLSFEGRKVMTRRLARDLRGVLLEGSM